MQKLGVIVGARFIGRLIFKKIAQHPTVQEPLRDKLRSYTAIWT